MRGVLETIAGLLMIGTAIVLGLAGISVVTGITTHNLLSMLALAGVLAVIATGLQRLLRVIPQRDERNTSEPNNPYVVPDQKQNIHFDPWTDEWYGSGPWWKKW